MSLTQGQMLLISSCVAIEDLAPAYPDLLVFQEKTEICILY